MKGTGSLADMTGLPKNAGSAFSTPWGFNGGQDITLPAGSIDSILPNSEENVNSVFFHATSCDRCLGVLDLLPKLC